MNKKNLIYIGVLAVLVLIYSLSKGLANYTEKQIDFFSVDSVNVSKIEISSKEGNIELAKAGNEWKLVKPVDYPAETSSVDRFFEKVLHVKATSTPLSESEESLKFFGLEDSVAINLKIYDSSNKLLENVYIAQADNYNYSLGRYADSYKVLQLNSQIFSMLTPKSDTWRKRTILDLEKDDIASINVKYTKNEYSLTATDTLWVYKDSEESFGIDQMNPQIQKVFGGLLFASTSQFLDFGFDEFAERFKEPTLTVDVTLKDGSKIKLTSIHLKEDNNRFLVMKDEGKDHLFYLPKSWSNRFTKSSNHFKKKK